jgi:hypothetical protein
MMTLWSERIVFSRVNGLLGRDMPRDLTGNFSGLKGDQEVRESRSVMRGNGSIAFRKLIELEN